MDYPERFVYFKSPRYVYMIVLLLAVQFSYINGIFTSEDCKALNTNSYCQCSNQAKSFQLECAAPTSRGKINIHIIPGKHVRIECNNTEANAYKIVPSMKIGNIKIVDIKYCPLPEGRPIAELLTHLGIQKVLYLAFKTDAHSANITKYQLSGMEYLQNLKLNTKSLENLPDNSVRNEDLRSINLSESFLEPLPNLEYLDLGQNLLEYLPNGVFKNQHKLEYLNLWKNNLRKLNKEVFRGVNALTVLNLESNDIESLEHDVFSLLGNMTSLDLNGNRIHELPEGLFAGNKHLTEFRLMHNKLPLKSLPTGLFANLPILEVVHMSCGLETLPMDMFTNSTKITNLNMKNNLLTTLPKNLLNDQHDLLYLDLSHNRLQSLPDTVFENTKNLVVLKLSYNQLVEISSELFKPLVNLEHLQLNNNNLVNISHNAFCDTANLKFLNLENNRINLAAANGFINSTSSPFRYLFKIQEINLRNNSIMYLHKDWRTQLLALRKLDLSYNKIHAFEDHDLRFVSKNMIKVNLTHNLIREINFNTIKFINVPNNTNRILIDLNNNPLHCDCMLLRFLKFVLGDFKKHKKLNKIKVVTNNLKCEGPPKLKGKGTFDLSYTELFCPLDEKFTQLKPCPINCECLVSPSDLTLFVNCSHNNMLYLPNLPHLPILRGIVLNVEHNRLTNLPLNTTTGYADVLKLHAASNQLQSIEASNLPEKLEYLDVRYNQLHRLSASFVNFLNNSTSLQAIYLAHNPLICDCDAKSLVEFIRNAAKRPKFAEQDMDHIRCIVKSTYPETDVKFMKSVSENEMCPINSSNNFPITCLVIVALTILIVVEIVRAFCVPLYQKYKRSVSRYSDKKYDAFISYAQLDEHCIIEQLTPELENGPLKYKLCLPKRDWSTEESFTKQFKRSVGQSQRTIVILSKNFLQMWSDKEFRKAHISALSSMRKRLIVIIYSDIDTVESLDEDLQRCLATSTFIKWGDLLFWPYLRAALPEETSMDVMVGNMSRLEIMVY